MGSEKLVVGTGPSAPCSDSVIERQLRYECRRLFVGTQPDVRLLISFAAVVDTATLRQRMSARVRDDIEYIGPRDC